MYIACQVCFWFFFLMLTYQYVCEIHVRFLIKKLHSSSYIFLLPTSFKQPSIWLKKKRFLMIYNIWHVILCLGLFSVASWTPKTCKWHHRTDTLYTRLALPCAMWMVVTVPSYSAAHNHRLLLFTSELHWFCQLVGAASKHFFRGAQYGVGGAVWASFGELYKQVSHSVWSFVKPIPL